MGSGLIELALLGEGLMYVFKLEPIVRLYDNLQSKELSGEERKLSLDLLGMLTLPTPLDFLVMSYYAEKKICKNNSIKGYKKAQPIKY